MQIDEDRMKSSLLSQDDDIRKQTRGNVFRAIKRRWIIVNMVILIVVISLSISAVVFYHQQSVLQKTLDQILYQIKQSQLSMEYRILNKTIKFYGQSNITQFNMISYRQETTTLPALRHLDFKNTQIQNIIGLYIPSVVTISLPKTLKKIYKTDLSQFPNFQGLTQVKMKLQKLQIQNISVLSVMFFEDSQLKQFIIDDNVIQTVDADLQKLQTLVLKNTPLEMSLIITSAKLLENIICENCLGQAFRVNTSNLKNLSSLCYFRTVRIQNSPLQTIGCHVFPYLYRLDLNQSTIRKIHLNAPKLLSVHIYNCPVQQLFLQNNSQQMGMLQMISTQISQFSNKKLNIKQINLSNNSKLSQFSNNTLLQTVSINCNSCYLKKVSNNTFSKISMLIIQNYDRKGQCQQFSNNDIASLYGLYIQNNTLTKVFGNNFSKLNTLILNNNYLNQQSIVQMIETNIWNISLIKLVELKNNNFTNISCIKTKLQQTFIHARIIF